MRLDRRTLNKETMQRILDCFVELTGIRAAYYDDHKELVNGKSKDICEFCRLISNYPSLVDGCMQSDMNAFETAERQKSLYLYQCHMGLWEAVIPLSIHGFSAGFLMLGQVRRIEKEGSALEEIKLKLSSGGVSPGDIAAMLKEYGRTLSLSSEKLGAAANMLDIIAHHVISSEVVAIRDLETVEKIRKLIHERFREIISTDSIAKQVDRSESYISSLFSRETGYTVTGYIEKTRVEKAKDLLDLTSMSVKEISFEIGYRDQNYFSRIFKKHVGMSPTFYRQNRRSSERGF